MQERHIYALAEWSVERRSNGWYFARSRNRHERKDWKGPYSSEFSVTLMIARQLRKELIARDQPQHEAAD